MRRGSIMYNGLYMTSHSEWIFFEGSKHINIVTCEQALWWDRAKNGRGVERKTMPGGGGGFRGRGRGREESSLSPLSSPVPLPFTSLSGLFSRFAPRPFFALSPRDSLFTGYKHSIYFRRKLSLTLSVKGKIWSVYLPDI